MRSSTAYLSNLRKSDSGSKKNNRKRQPDSRGSLPPIPSTLTTASSFRSETIDSRRQAAVIGRCSCAVTKYRKTICIDTASGR